MKTHVGNEDTPHNKQMHDCVIKALLDHRFYGGTPSPGEGCAAADSWEAPRIRLQTSLLQLSQPPSALRKRRHEAVDTSCRRLLL